MVKHKLVSFVAVVALWTHEILLIKLIRNNSSSGNTYKTKIMPFWPLCCESEAILSKKISSRLPRDFGPGFPYEHMEIFTNGRVERRDLSSRDIPVDWFYI